MSGKDSASREKYKMKVYFHFYVRGAAYLRFLIKVVQIESNAKQKLVLLQYLFYHADM